MKFEPKKKVSLADTKRALHQVMQQDGLAFPETPEDIDRLEATLDESGVPTPDVNAFLKYLRGEASAPAPLASNILPFASVAHTEDLAMAARNGGTIDAATRQRMNEHRAAATEKTKHKPK